jgi:hypothetical protein
MNAAISGTVITQVLPMRGFAWRKQSKPSDIATPIPTTLAYAADFRPRVRGGAITA